MVGQTEWVRVAVVGHVEWIRFARVDHVPDTGDIAHSLEDWEQAGGGGGVAAVQLALLADEAHLFTALGGDELGRRSRAELEARGVVVHSAPDERPQRWAFTHVDDRGERTIACPVRALWGGAGALPLFYEDPLELWRPYAPELTGRAVEGASHFLVEDAPGEVADDLAGFFAAD